jgi:hypothetical protein
MMKSKVKSKAIRRAYIRTYSDSGQVTAYVEWVGGGRTEGATTNAHMLALLARAEREGVAVEEECW